MDVSQQARYFAVIPAAGVGSRMGSDIPKQYLKVAGKPVLRHTVDAFLKSNVIAHTYVVVSPEDTWASECLPQDPRLSILYRGGASRRDTVLNALLYLREHVSSDDWILVHDAARPGINSELISKLIREVGTHTVGGLLALPVVDTVKQKLGDHVKTISRENLWLAQTPQMFRHALLVKALTQCLLATDESSAVELLGSSPLLVEGHARNLKLTTSADLLLATHYLA